MACNRNKFTNQPHVLCISILQAFRTQVTVYVAYDIFNAICTFKNITPTPPHNPHPITTDKIQWLLCMKNLPMDPYIPLPYGPLIDNIVVLRLPPYPPTHKHTHTPALNIW